MSTRGHPNRHDPLVERPRVPSVRLTLIYVVAVALIATAVALIATVGFTKQSPWPIVLAVLLALPASIVAAIRRPVTEVTGEEVLHGQIRPGRPGARAAGRATGTYTYMG